MVANLTKCIYAFSTYMCYNSSTATFPVKRQYEPIAC